MKAPSAALLERVTEVVAGCLEQDRSPADVMARAPSLRGASAGARSEVSRWSLRACGACKSIFYCSPACQRHDWRAHKAQCRQQALQRAEYKQEKHAAALG